MALHRSNLLEAAALWFAVALLSPFSCQAGDGLKLSSPAFIDGSAIPVPYTCKGTDKSPPLAWRGVPEPARGLALIVDDPDAPGGDFIHWVVYNLPASTTLLREGVAKEPELEAGTRQGANGFGQLGYGGPCPPPGKPHHYHFRLYALDSLLKLESGVEGAELLRAMHGHVLASTELIGTFGR